MDPNASKYSASSSSPPASGQSPSPQAETPSSDPRGPTVIVRTSTVPLVLMILFSLMLGVGLLFSLGFNIYAAAAYSQYFQTDTDLTEAYHSGDKFAEKKIAVIQIDGVMMESEGYAKKQIDRAGKDKQVKAIVLRVNSPGGAVTAADYLFHHLIRVRDERSIPIVVSMGSMAASGGYYVAMAASDEERVIFAEPTCITGSIGVIIPHYDISELLATYDIKNDSIVSHELKELGSWTKEMTPEERRKLQEQVDLLFNRFKEIVREGRPMLAKDEDALNQVATGEVFTGEQAKDLMLVDEVGFIEDAIERAAELSKLDNSKYRVVKYQRVPTLADALTGSMVEAPQSPVGVRQLMNLTTPRAYYLYSWLPGVAVE